MGRMDFVVEADVVAGRFLERADEDPLREGGPRSLPDEAPLAVLPVPDIAVVDVPPLLFEYEPAGGGAVLEDLLYDEEEVLLPVRLEG